MNTYLVQQLRIVADRSFAVDDANGFWECIALSPIIRTTPLETFLTVPQRRHLRLVFKDQEAIDRLLNTESKGLEDLQVFIRFVRKYQNVFVMTREEFIKFIGCAGEVTPAISSNWVVALRDTAVVTDEMRGSAVWLVDLLTIYGLTNVFNLPKDTYYRATFELALQYAQQRLENLFDRNFTPKPLESAEQVNRNCLLVNGEALVVPAAGARALPYITWGESAPFVQETEGFVEYLETPRVVRQKQWRMKVRKPVPFDIMAAVS